MRYRLRHQPGIDHLWPREQLLGAGLGGAEGWRRNFWGGRAKPFIQSCSDSESVVVEATGAAGRGSEGWLTKCLAGKPPRDHHRLNCRVPDVRGERD